MLEPLLLVAAATVAFVLAYIRGQEALVARLEAASHIRLGKQVRVRVERGGAILIRLDCEIQMIGQPLATNELVFVITPDESLALTALLERQRAMDQTDPVMLHPDSSPAPPSGSPARRP